MGKPPAFFRARQCARPRHAAPRRRRSSRPTNRPPPDPANASATSTRRGIRTSPNPTRATSAHVATVAPRPRADRPTTACRVWSRDDADAVPGGPRPQIPIPAGPCPTRADRRQPCSPDTAANRRGAPRRTSPPPAKGRRAGRAGRAGTPRWAYADLSELTPPAGGPCRRTARAGRPTGADGWCCPP